MFRMTNF